MDIDSEMERLSQEVRRKMDEERRAAEADAAAASDQDVEAEAEARRLADEADEPVSTGGKALVVVAMVIGFLVLGALALKLLKLALFLAVMAALVWGVVKLVGAFGGGKGGP